MDARIVKFLENSCNARTPAVYEKSIVSVDDGLVFMMDCGAKDCLVAVDCPGFSGEERVLDGVNYTVAPLNHENAVALRKLLPFTAPSPVLGEKRTIGLGDRLGLATDGHMQALEGYDAIPVFAQQSIRELNLTNRTFHDVLDCVSFAVLRSGFRRPFGADGDHLKTPAEVQMAIDCGCTMITLDCSEHIRGEAANMSDEETAAACADYPELEERYLNQVFRVEDHEICFTPAELGRCILIYGKAIDFATKIYRDFMEGKPMDFELSIDETTTPTSPAQHFFVAKEMAVRGVKPATVAPRFCGEFQKGIDYIGDVEQYAAEFSVHAAIARTFGYKLSIHSGSDKFSVFPVSGELSQGTFHVKTAGTNWLEAMRVVAEHEPALYREIHTYALETAFEQATKYYHVTTDLTKIPALDTLADSELGSLFDLNDARQLIHITYGLILTVKDETGSPLFRDRLYDFWRKNRPEYAARLKKHIGHHLELLYSRI